MNPAGRTPKTRPRPQMVSASSRRENTLSTLLISGLVYWIFTAIILLGFMRLHQAQPRALYTVALIFWPATAVLILTAAVIARLGAALGAQTT